MPIPDKLDRDLCKTCYSNFTLAPKNLCRVCGAPASAPSFKKNVCENCLSAPAHFDVARSLFIYSGTIKKLILKIKYSKDLYAAKSLGNLSRRYINSFYDFLNRPYQIIPIPLHKKKFIKRGINQSTLLAEYLFLNSKINSSLLLRQVNTASQKGLSKNSRIKNMKNAFKVNGRLDSKTTYILFDDVFTTGATVDSASAALKNAGANYISVLTIARTEIASM